MPYRLRLAEKKLESELGSIWSDEGISGDDLRLRDDSALGSATVDSRDAIKSSSAMALGAGR
jgi:hypothetical protein